MFGRKSLKRRIEDLERQHSHGLQSTLKIVVPIHSRLESQEEQVETLFDMLTTFQAESAKNFPCPRCGIVIDPKARLGRERQFGESIKCPCCEATIYGKGAVAHY